MLEQIVRAAILDGRIYRDLGESPEVLFRAMGIVLLAALAFGLGMRNEAVLGYGDDDQILKIFVAASSVFLGWVLWSFVSFVIGRMMRSTATYRQTLRALGIAFAPGVLLVFFGVPSVIGPIVVTIAKFWLLAAGLIAVSETHNFGPIKAFVPTIIGWYMSQLLLPAFLLPLEAT